MLALFYSILQQQSRPRVVWAGLETKRRLHGSGSWDQPLPFAVRGWLSPCLRFLWKILGKFFGTHSRPGLAGGVVAELEPAAGGKDGGHEQAFGPAGRRHENGLAGRAALRGW